MSLLNSYTESELRAIVEKSNSWRDLARNLGYNCNSGDLKASIQKRIEELNISTQHFKTVASNAIERNEGNIFIEHSTADQSTLRKWYLKGHYTEYQCFICGQEPIWQDKPLTLILDHINGVNNDDRLENLRWVCPNCNIQLPTTGRTNSTKSAKKYYCIDCGKEVSSYTVKRCQDCASKHRTIPLEDMPVSREELKNLIRTKPFTQIGVMFSVTDNAIRKWCNKFNLPRKASEIKQYSDEEWSKI